VIRRGAKFALTWVAPRHLRRREILTVVIALAAASPQSSIASPDPLPLETACAAYDLHLVTLIEDHGLAGATEPDVLRGAVTRMLDARIACRNGERRRALQIYDSIELAPVRIMPFHRVLLP
jgi:hypothetical protein